MHHLVFVVVVLCFLAIIFNKKIPLYYFGILMLFIFSFLRYDFGNDYMNYLEGYNAIKLNINTHIGKSYLYRLLNVYSPSFNFLIFLTTLFYFIVIFKLIFSNVKKNRYWMSVLILLLNPYLFLIHLSAIRQTIAILFFIISVKYIYERKIIKYIFCLVIAAGFHKSSLLLIPFYFFLNTKKISKKEYVFIFLSIIFIFTNYFQILLNIILQKFPGYIFYLKNAQGNSIRSIIFSAVYFIFVLLYLNRLKEKKIIYGKLYLISTIISIWTIKIAMLTRIGMYFDIFMIITIPNLLEEIKDKNIRLFFTMILFSIFLLRYLSFFNTELWRSFFEYKTIFNK